MEEKTKQLTLALLMFLLTCYLASVLIAPFSILNYLGPAAGIASALTILWGRIVLYSIVIGLIVFHIILHFFFGVDFNVAVVLISGGAIVLQCLWVKQLTYRETNKQEWLDSRLLLSLFIAKIGPLVGLVVACATLVITVLHVEGFNGNLAYAFFQTWSSHILVCIFATPIFIFVAGKQRISTSKRLFVVFSSLLGSIAIALLMQNAQQQLQHQRADQFNEAKVKVYQILQQGARDIAQQVTAHAAYFNASHHVSNEEYIEFSSNMYTASNAIKAVLWLPILENKNRKRFEQQLSEDLDIDYALMEFSGGGMYDVANARSEYLPIKYVYPTFGNEVLYGIDLKSEYRIADAISYVDQYNKIASTAPIVFAADNIITPSILVLKNTNRVGSYQSIRLNTQSPQSEDVSSANPEEGYIGVVVDLQGFFSSLEKIHQDKNISINIDDIGTEHTIRLFGDDVATENRLSKQYQIPFFSRNWQVVISETEAWIVEDKGWQAWAGLIGGMLGGILYQLLILIMTTYSVELTNQVHFKTRELTRARNKSEKEIAVKNNFLKTLDKEIRVPLNVIQRLAEVFPNEHGDEKSKEYISNIKEASVNIEQLLDTLSDLSSIDIIDNQLQYKKLDLPFFLRRIENMLKALPESERKPVRLIVNQDVPQFVKTDELRLQQLLIAFARYSIDEMGGKGVCISINAHIHQENTVTLLFSVTALDIYISNGELDESTLKPTLNKAITTRSTVVDELVKLFGGNIKKTKLPSNDEMLTLSIKMILNSDKSTS